MTDLVLQYEAQAARQPMESLTITLMMGKKDATIECFWFRVKAGFSAFHRELPPSKEKGFSLEVRYLLAGM